MKTENYNGWTNYSTWRVNLELIDSDYYYDVLDGNTDFSNNNDLDINKDDIIYDLSVIIKEDIENYLSELGTGIVLDYALTFIDDVNWYEIAQHIYNDYKGL